MLININKNIFFSFVRVFILCLSFFLFSSFNSVFASCTLVASTDSDLLSFPDCYNHSYCSEGNYFHVQTRTEISCITETYECTEYQCVAPTIANDPYDYTLCPSGQSLSCGSTIEAVAQSKQFCGYRITCNKYFWPSLISLPAPCNANPVSATCSWNCSCCSIGTSRSCTTGAIYNRYVTIDKTNYSALENARAKTTCNTHDDIFIDNFLIREYTNKWDEQLEDWRIQCRENTCVCRAPSPTPSNTPTPSPTPFIRVNVKDTDGTYHSSSGICGVDCSGTVCTKKGAASIYCSANDWNFTFPKFTATNTYIGGRIELTDNQSRPLTVLGVTPSVVGFVETTCNGIGGYCYVWNKNSWTTGGRTVDFVVAIPTNTPTPTASPTPTPTIPVAPGPWIKLKDTSFISANALDNNIPAVPVLYDADDTPANAYFIRDVAGITAAPAINITGLNAAAKTGSPEYKATYSPNSYSLTPNSFLSYIKARKQHTTITNINQITGSGIYVYSGNLSINSSSSPFNQSYNIVLIATGTVTVTRVAPDTTFAPGGSVAVIAPTINFNAGITEANGIFIANNINTGTNVSQGLKMIGNLVAQTSFTNGREWADLNKPSLFVKFDPTHYVKLLPYLSTANYEWRQIQ